MVKQTINIITKMDCDHDDYIKFNDVHNIKIDEFIEDGYTFICDVKKMVQDYYNAPEKFCRIATLERMV